MLESRELTFFDSESGDDFVVPFGQHMAVRIYTVGENRILFNTSTLIDLEALSDKKQTRLMRNLMRRADRLFAGSYVGYPKLTFEVALPVLEDGVVTQEQLTFCFAVVASELQMFHHNWKRWSKADDIDFDDDDSGGDDDGGPDGDMPDPEEMAKLLERLFNNDEDD